MRNRIWIISLTGAFVLWLGVQGAALAQSAELMEAYHAYQTLYAQGKYAEAEVQAREAMRLATAEFGPDDPHTALHMNNLGELYAAHEREAELRVRRNRAVRSGGGITNLMPFTSHFAEGTGFENQAIGYNILGRAGEAEPLFLRSLAIREKALGPDHPDVAESLNNLAHLYYHQSKHEESERLFQRSLAIREKVLGPKHPDVAETLSTIAQHLNIRRSYREVYKLYHRSLKIRKKALGKQHPLVAQSYEELANFYGGRSGTGGENYYLRSLSIWKKAAGPEHPRVAMLLNALAVIHSEDGFYKKAKPLLEQSLAIREEVFGPDHPAVAAGLNNLAILYFVQRKYEKAEPLFQRALAIRKKTMGPENRDTAKSLENYAALLRKTDRKDEAKVLEARARAIRGKK